MDIDELLGIDRTDPMTQRAEAMFRGDKQLVRKLVERREQLGMTQRDVAARMDVSQSAVARFETGYRDPRQSTIRRYALAVDVVITHDIATADEFHGDLEKTPVNIQVSGPWTSWSDVYRKTGHWLELNGPTFCISAAKDMEPTE